MMARTDHARKAKRPEHSDQAPRYQHRPQPRRQTTRRMAVTAALKEA